MTAERGENQFTRQGLEEYITDAVISLDHRVDDQKLAGFARHLMKPVEPEVLQRELSSISRAS